MRDDTTRPDVTGLKRRFSEVVDDEGDIRAVVGQPPARSVAKVIDRIDGYARRFIARAPFVFVASAGADGTVELVP